MKIYFALLLLVFVSAAVAGPIVPSRSFILAPKFRDTKDTTKCAKYLRQNGLWGNLARGFGSTDERFAWSMSFGGIIQFVEGENSMFYLQGDADVLSDNHNDIGFNPRAIFWTEGLVYGLRLDSTNELHLGYIHRCKHDIDNLDKQVVAANEERTLIYGSLMGKYVARDFQFIEMNTSTSAQLDMYLYKQDYRYPFELTDSGASVTDLNFSLELSAKVDIGHFGDVVAYFRPQVRISSYNWLKTIQQDQRLEVGVELKGEATTMDIFIGTERLEDDMNRPLPVNSRYVYLGLRFIANSIGM